MKIKTVRWHRFQSPLVGTSGITDQDVPTSTPEPGRLPGTAVESHNKNGVTASVTEAGGAERLFHRWKRVGKKCESVTLPAKWTLIGRL